MSTEVEDPPVSAKTDAPQKSNAAAGHLVVVQGALAECDAVEAGLEDLRKRYKGVAFDVTTTKGMDEAKAARMEIRDVRYRVQRALERAKRPLNDLKRAVADRADEIVGAVMELETPIDDQIKAEEQRKADERAARERAEQQRIESVTNKITEIRLIPSKLVGATSANIQEIINDLAAKEITEAEFAEFKTTAEQAKLAAMADLDTLLRKTIDQEAEAVRQRQEAERLAEQRQQQEAAAAAQREENRRREAELAEQRKQQDAAAAAEREALARQQEEVRRAQERVEEARRLLAQAEAEAAEAVRKAAEKAAAEAAAAAREGAERMQKAAPAMLQALRSIYETSTEANVVQLARDAIVEATGEDLPW